MSNLTVAEKLDLLERIDRLPLKSTQRERLIDELLGDDIPATAPVPVTAPLAIPEPTPVQTDVPNNITSDQGKIYQVLSDFFEKNGNAWATTRDILKGTGIPNNYVYGYISFGKSRKWLEVQEIDVEPSEASGWRKQMKLYRFKV